MAPPKRSEADKEEEQKAVLGALIDEFVQQGVPPRVPIIKHYSRINQDAIYDRPHGAHTWRDRLLFAALHVVNEVRAAQGFKLLDDGRESTPRATQVRRRASRRRWPRTCSSRSRISLRRRRSLSWRRRTASRCPRSARRAATRWAAARRTCCRRCSLGA